MTEDTRHTLNDFLALSEALTGFSRVELEGTGLAQTYFNTVDGILGERIFGRLLLTSHGILAGSAASIEKQIRKQILDSAFLGPVARNIILLWYVGNWNQMPGPWRDTYGASARDLTHVVSAEAYKEGLMWRAIEAHPPAAKSPGFGTWTAPPGGRTDLIDDMWTHARPEPAGQRIALPAKRRGRRAAAKA